MTFVSLLFRDSKLSWSSRSSYVLVCILNILMIDKLFLSEMPCPTIWYATKYRSAAAGSMTRCAYPPQETLFHPVCSAHPPPPTRKRNRVGQLYCKVDRWVISSSSIYTHSLPFLLIPSYFRRGKEDRYNTVILNLRIKFKQLTDLSNLLSVFKELSLRNRLLWTKPF